MSESTPLPCEQTAEALRHHLEQLLNARLELFSLMLLAAMPVSCSRFRIIKGELGFKVSFIATDQNEYSDKLLCDELELVIRSLEVAGQTIKPAGIFEKLVVLVRKKIWRLVQTPLPDAMLKMTLNLFVNVQWNLLQQVHGARPDQLSRLHALSCLLHEPKKRMVSITRQHQFYLHWNYARRLRHLHKRVAAPSGQHDFCWPEREAYIALNRDCKDSRVLLTIHMGDFFGAFKCIGDALDESRSVISLRREGDTDAIKTLSARHAGDHQVFTHEKNNPLAIVRALRAGGQTLSVLFDLGADFGETTEVEFFGHRARFVRGPAELALTGKATFYPFVCFTQNGVDHICMEPAFTPQLRAGESLQQAVQRVTQKLVNMAERWIRQHPAQWKYLDRLPDRLQAHYRVRAAASDTAGDSASEACQGA